jgi:hypothetical protein
MAQFRLRFRKLARARGPYRVRPFATAALVVLALVTAPGLSPRAHAQDDFFRSSPGALSASHASIDGQNHCNDCHSGGREVNDNKCLDCHDHNDLRARIRAGKGFHASSKIKGKRCGSCHIEHKGRGYDLMGWSAVGGMKSFDHKLAGWPLKGKHAATDCKDCHKKTNRQGLRVFLGEEALCGSCHKSDQPHGFTKKALLACDRCHTESVWKPAKRRQQFDHDKDTEMPLVGSHQDVSCAKCHPKSKFNLGNKNPDGCDNCHKNPHDGHLFGKKECGWCHSPTYRSLRSVRFNHAKRTRFDLAGAHGKQKCYSCHTKRIGTRVPEKACAQCHADDNRHKNRFNQFGSPPQCEICHPSTSWKPRVFNHDARTRFDLSGKHAKVECRTCHRGKGPADFERFDPKKVGCMGCHSHKNVHDRKFKDKQCLECHKDSGQKQLTAKSVETYHGPKSRFPLIKGHEGVECTKCHINDVYQNTPMECGQQCHEDSLHNGSLGEECSRCHSTGVWEATEFKHAEDTNYPLKGLHATVPQCTDCHPGQQFSGTPTTCSAQACHGKDDVHLGKLGQRCDDCHVETGENIFNHNTMSVFALTGQHLETRCSDCHPKVTFKPRPTKCFGCHPEPAAHKGQYGTVCETCHTPQGWLDIKALHDVGEFALKGAHDNQPCVRCHKDSRQLAGSGNLCINCHRQDDIHSNSLSPRCGECHTQWAFAPARFDHTTVGCNLTGLHRTLSCYDCHKTGNFGGLSAQCFSCHRDTALQVNNVDHAGFVLCSTCHNPNFWKPAAVGNNYASGRNSICR